MKFEELVKMMVDGDTSCVPQRHGVDARNATTLAEQRRELYLRDGGLVATPLRGRRYSAMHPGYEVKNYFE